MAPFALSAIKLPRVVAIRFVLLRTMPFASCLLHVLPTFHATTVLHLLPFCFAAIDVFLLRRNTQPDITTAMFMHLTWHDFKNGLALQSLVDLDMSAQMKPASPYQQDG